MLHLSLGISIVFLALSRHAAPNSEAFDGQERNKGGLLSNTSSGAYSAVYPAVRLKLDRKTSEQAPRDGSVMGQPKVLLRSDDDKSLPVRYPSTILHARGSQLGRLEKGGRPRCLICRHLCVGDAINRFACPIQFQDFGWTRHLRGNQDPKRLGLVESSKRQPECLICRKFCEENPVHGYICQQHFRDFGSTYFDVQENNRNRLHTRHAYSALMGSTSADGLTECWLPAPTDNGLIRARHMVSRRLEARSDSMRCTICHRQYYESRFLGTFCPVHAHLGWTCEVHQKQDRLHLRTLQKSGGLQEQHVATRRLERRSVMRCNDNPEIGTCEARSNQDRLTLHTHAANSTYKARVSTSGHLTERSESKRRRQNQLHLHMRQPDDNLQARHPKCVICNTTCQEVRKHVFGCPEHRNFKWACEYSSRKLADAYLYFDSHNPSSD